MRHREIELTGLTMGIVGFGGTGRAMARRAAAFGLTCRALDRILLRRRGGGGRRAGTNFPTLLAAMT